MKESELKKTFEVKIEVWRPVVETRTVLAKDYDDAVEQVADEFGEYFKETIDCYEKK